MVRILRWKVLEVDQFSSKIRNYVSQVNVTYCNKIHQYNIKVTIFNVHFWPTTITLEFKTDNAKHLTLLTVLYKPVTSFIYTRQQHIVYTGAAFYKQMGKFLSKYIYYSSQRALESQPKVLKLKHRNHIRFGSKVEALLADCKDEEKEQLTEVKIPQFFDGKQRQSEQEKSIHTVFNEEEEHNSPQDVQDCIFVWNGSIVVNDNNPGNEYSARSQEYKMSIYAFSEKGQEIWQRYNWPSELQVVEVLDRIQLKPFQEEIRDINPKFGIELEHTWQAVLFFEQSRRWSRGYILRADENINQEVMLIFEYRNYPTLILLPET